MSFGKKGLTGPTFDAAPQGDASLPQREPRVHRLMKVTLFHERFGSADGVIRDISSGGLGGRAPRLWSPAMWSRSIDRAWGGSRRKCAGYATASSARS